MAARARRIQAELDALAADVASVHDEVAGSRPHRASSAPPPAGSSRRSWRPMAERHPRVRVVVRRRHHLVAAAPARRGRLDLAVLNLPVDDPDLVTEPLFDEDRLLVAPLGHPLAGRERSTLADLDGAPAAARAAGHRLPRPARRAGRRAGLELVPKAEVDGIRLMASLAFQGFGAAIVPASAAPGWLGGDWRTIPIDGLDGPSVGIAGAARGYCRPRPGPCATCSARSSPTGPPHQPGIHPARS